MASSRKTISLPLATVSPTSFFYSNNRRQPALLAIEVLGHTLASWEPALSIIESPGVHTRLPWLGPHVLPFLCLHTSKWDFFHPVTVKSLLSSYFSLFVGLTVQCPIFTHSLNKGGLMIGGSEGPSLHTHWFLQILPQHCFAVWRHSSAVTITCITRLA